MYRIRMARQSDLDSLFDLSHLGHFLNLPQDRELLEKKIELSCSSVSKSSPQITESEDDYYFLFVIEDLNGKILGCSGLNARHGTPQKPHVYFSVEKEISSYKDLGPFSWEKLTFGKDCHGVTELGGLVLHPSARGKKIGKALSFSRFFYMHQNDHQFMDSIHCEIMPPVHPLEGNALWKEVGEVFTGLSYHEADLLSREDSLFICHLFPKSPIYLRYLSEHARAMIGAISQNSLAVVPLLKEIGLSYANQIDPFDGGPHYKVHKDQIKLYERFQTLRCGTVKNKSNKVLALAQIKTDDEKGFCCYFGDFQTDGDYLDTASINGWEKRFDDAPVKILILASY